MRESKMLDYRERKVEQIRRERRKSREIIKTTKHDALRII